MTIRGAAFYSDGLKLVGELYHPEAQPPPEGWPGVVVTGGFTGNRAFNTREFCKVFAQRGWVAISFDHRGFGDSQGTRGRRIPLERVADIRNALTFLGAQPDVNPKRLALMGHSFGGGECLYAAATDPRARAVVALNAVVNGERWLRNQRRLWEWTQFKARLDQDRVRRVLTGQGEYVNPYEIMIVDPETEDYHRMLAEKGPEWARKITPIALETAEAVIEFKPEELTHRIAPRATLILNAGISDMMPPEDARALYESALEPKRLVIFEEAHHHDVSHEPLMGEMMDLVLAWLCQYV